MWSDHTPIICGMNTQSTFVNEQANSIDQAIRFVKCEDQMKRVYSFFICGSGVYIPLIRKRATSSRPPSGRLYCTDTDNEELCIHCLLWRSRRNCSEIEFRPNPRGDRFDSLKSTNLCNRVTSVKILIVDGNYAWMPHDCDLVASVIYKLKHSGASNLILYTPTLLRFYYKYIHLKYFIIIQIKY